MQKLNFWRSILVLGIGALAPGCGQFEVPDPEAARRDGEPIFDLKTVESNQKSAQSAARAQNGFGLKLLGVAAAKNPAVNTFISPSSVWMALAMAENGAGGATQVELKRVLALPSDKSDSIQALRAVLGAQGLQIKLANALWADKAVTFPPAFLQKSAQEFGAKAQTLDFGAPKSVDVINDWVKTQTAGEISGILEDLPASGAVLTNALYFRGRWTKPFDKDETAEAPFYRADKTQKSVALMAGEGFQGIKGAGFEGAILPYANSSCELWAILPAQGKTPRDVVAQLDAKKLAQITPSFQTSVRLPCFSLDWSDSLGASLQTLGLKAAFVPSSDWRALGLPPGSRVDEVVHKTRLEISETGTVAAAATAITMAGSAASPPDKILVFNRPFVLLLRETRSGALLFAGIINDPEPLT